jgi:hypothetical protein
MKIVSDSDMYISTTWGASIRLYAGEPKELGDDISLVALQQGAKEVKEEGSVSKSSTILTSEEEEVEDAIVIDINDNRDREDKLKAALQQVLDEGSPSDFTTDGLPKQSVIKGVFGEQISSDERDEIWAEIIVGKEG